MREFIKQIAVSLREDDHWFIDAHWATNDKLGVKVWIANGFWFSYIEWSAERRSYGGWVGDVRVRLSLPEKVSVWSAFEHLKKTKKAQLENDLVATIVSRRLNTKEQS